MESNIDRLNEALATSRENALKFHAENNQPIVYRDTQNRLIEEYPDGRIVVILDYNNI